MLKIFKKHTKNHLFIHYKNTYLILCFYYLQILLNDQGGDLVQLTHLRDLSILSVILRLSMAILFGGIIGMERGMKNRAAGFKTHMLVCIGSTLAMLTNQYIISFFNGTGDPSRLGAQVISGVGFLGAGTILVTGKQQVKGLTTAASLWASACMGLAIGIGFYEGAIIGCCFIFSVLTILNKVDMYLLSKSKFVDLYIELDDPRHFRRLLDCIRSGNDKIIHIQTNKSISYDVEVLECFITIQQAEKYQHQTLINFISQIEGVNFVEEL